MKRIKVKTMIFNTVNNIRQVTGAMLLCLVASTCAQAGEMQTLQKERAEQELLKQSLLLELRTQEKQMMLDQENTQQGFHAELEEVRSLVTSLKRLEKRYRDAENITERQHRLYLEKRNQDIVTIKARLMEMMNKYLEVVEASRSRIAKDTTNDTVLVLHFGAIESTLDYILTDLKSPNERIRAYNVILANLSADTMPF